MEGYGNKGKDSEVVGYEIRLGSIVAAFKDSRNYIYNEIRLSIAIIFHFQQLVRCDHGLNSYLSK